jgi:hypothetical protein
VYILYFPQFSSQNLTLASALPPEREAVITLAIYLNSQAVSLGFCCGAC